VQLSREVLLDRVSVARVSQRDLLGDLQQYGAGLVVTSCEQVQLQQCEFSEVHSGTAAPILVADSLLVSVDRLSVRNCSAASVGALLSLHSQLSASELTLRDNRASGPSGALSIQGGTLLLVDSLLSGNRAYEFGGALSLSDGAKAQLSRVQLLDNRVLSPQGQVSVPNPADPAADPLLFDSTRGGAVSLLGEGTSLQLHDCLLSGNYALYGAGLYVGVNTQLNASQTTVRQNLATRGSALYLDRDSDTSFPNGNLIDGTIYCVPTPRTLVFGFNVCSGGSCSCSNTGSPSPTPSPPSPPPSPPSPPSPPPSPPPANQCLPPMHLCSNGSCVSSPIACQDTVIIIVGQDDSGSDNHTCTGQGQFPGGTVSTCNFPPDTVLLVSPPNPSVDYGETASQVVQITPSQQPDGPVDLTFVVEELDGNLDQYCLAFFREDTLRWECVDECLRQSTDGNLTLVTGTTDHFSTFAVLLGGGGCSPVAFGVWLASLVCVAAALVLVLAAILLIRYNRRVRDLFGGSEETRVRNLRRRMAEVNSATQTSATTLEMTALSSASGGGAGMAGSGMSSTTSSMLTHSKPHHQSAAADSSALLTDTASDYGGEDSQGEDDDDMV